MKFFTSKSRQSGFSLVELMVVVAIIGILAALAVPKFQSFQAKARQSEAKNNLSHIYTLEMSYYGDNDTYIAVDKIGADACDATNPIGFRVTGCKSGKVRYNYTVALAGDGFLATAENGSKFKIVSGCADKDRWTMDEDKNLTAVENAVETCK